MTTIERTVSSTSTKLTARSSTCSTISSTRKQNRSQFAKYYSDLCHIQHSHPLTAIKQNLDKGILDFYCDRIKIDEWWSIINALSYDKTLHFVAIRSRHPQTQPVETADTELKARTVTKQPVVTTRFVLLRLIEAIKMCLSQSSTLTVLELEGLPMLGDYLTVLSTGLLETTTLQHLSLSKCPIRDEGADVICHTIKNLPSILSLDLSHCGLTPRGAEIIAGLIKYQKINRYSEAWKQTLRYRDPDVESMPGLRRITINNNPGLGDKGISILTEEIKDDLWLRALDVQDCGLTNEGGRLLLDLLENNSNLVIVDGRGNPYMSDEMLLEIMNLLALNNQNKNDTEYKWINKNPDLNKKKFVGSVTRSRPWTCHSSTNFVTKNIPPSESGSTVNLTRCNQIKRSNTTLGQEGGGTWRKSKRGVVNDKSLQQTQQTFAENERLRLQLRDLTLILSQEVRHKLELMEENKTLKELLQKGEYEKKNLQAEGNKRILVAEDTLKVLEETLSRFGTYIEHKKDDDTSESLSTITNNDEDEIPELVSNLKVLLKKAASSTDQSTNESEKTYRKQLEKVKHSKSETRSKAHNDKKFLIDLQIGDSKEEESDKHRVILEKKRKSRWLKNRPRDQIIWEEEESNSNCGDSFQNDQLEVGKSKAQAMFLKLLQEQQDTKTDSRQTHKIKYNSDGEGPNSHDEVSSNDSDYELKCSEFPEKPLSSSCEGNSS